MPAPDEEIAETTVDPLESEPVTLPKLSKKMLRKFALLLLVIIVTGKSLDKLLEVAQMKSGERQEKIQALNETMTDGLNHMRPSFVAGQFFGRLMQPHGLVFGQWKAPFNAQVALDDLDRKERLRTQPVTYELNSLDNRSDGESQAARTTIEKWELGRLIPSRGYGAPIAFVLNTLLALPDAYLDLTKNLLPHLPWAFRVIVVLLVFLTALIIAGRRDNFRPALWFLFLLPIGVSLLASLYAGVVWGFSALVHPIAPTLSVTGGSIISPFLLWTSSKVAEHHLVEGILHRLPKALTGE